MGEVAEKTHPARGAESTSKHASHLGGDAYGEAVGCTVRVKIGNENGFYFLGRRGTFCAILGCALRRRARSGSLSIRIKPKQKLDGTVCGLLLPIDVDGSNDGLLREFCP